MTAEQVEAWFAIANSQLEALKGPFDFPMPVQFCDGHGLHRSDAQTLHQALTEARDHLLARAFGEDGPAYGVPTQQLFIETCAIIANAQRVEGEIE